MGVRKYGATPVAGGLLLGVDAGGTKTLAAVADADGRVLGMGRGGNGNYQSAGRAFAKLNIAQAIERALSAAGAAPADVVAAGYGVAGADRDKDFEVIHQFLDEVSPTGAYVLCNDTTLALRAGTDDGVGVACVAGTGSNTMGFNAAGDHVKVGGFGPFSHDPGSSYGLVMRAVEASFRHWDGSGPPTALSDMFCQRFHLDEVADLIELEFFDTDKVDFHLNQLAPKVFEIAAEGDRVARGILERAGREMGSDAVSCLKRLFPVHDEPVPLVLGGSIFQKAADRSMILALEKTVRKVFPKVELKRLADEPCVGALILAKDLERGRTAAKNWQRALKRSFQARFAEFAG